jgi:hypothetical protein
MERASGETSRSAGNVDIFQLKYTEADILMQVLQMEWLNRRGWRDVRIRIRFELGVPVGGGNRMEEGRAHQTRWRF